MEATRLNPTRFEDTKLFGRNSWLEFCKWDRVDTVGFLACSALSGVIIAFFIAMLRWAAP